MTKARASPGGCGPRAQLAVPQLGNARAAAVQLPAIHRVSAGIIFTAALAPSYPSAFFTQNQISVETKHLKEGNRYLDIREWIVSGVIEIRALNACFNSI